MGASAGRPLRARYHLSRYWCCTGRPWFFPVFSHSSALVFTKLYSPAVKCTPRTNWPLAMMPPPTPVPMINTAALQQPCKAPARSSAMAAALPSFSSVTRQPHPFAHQLPPPACRCCTEVPRRWRHSRCWHPQSRAAPWRYRPLHPYAVHTERILCRENAPAYPAAWARNRHRNGSSARP